MLNLNEKLFERIMGMLDSLEICAEGNIDRDVITMYANDCDPYGDDVVIGLIEIAGPERYTLKVGRGFRKVKCETIRALAMELINFGLADSWLV